jgi:hypothetical protein
MTAGSTKTARKKGGGIKTEPTMQKATEFRGFIVSKCALVRKLKRQSMTSQRHP